MKKFLFSFLIIISFFSASFTKEQTPKDLYASSRRLVLEVKAENPSEEENTFRKSDTDIQVGLIGLISWLCPTAALVGGLNFAYEYLFCDSKVLQLDRYKVKELEHNKGLLKNLSSKPLVPGLVLKGGLAYVKSKNEEHGQIIPSMEAQMPLEINNSDPEDTLNRYKAHNHILHRQENIEEEAQSKEKSPYAYLFDFLIPAVATYAASMIARKYGHLSERQINTSLLGAAAYVAYSEIDHPLVNNENSRTIERTKKGLKVFTSMAIGAKTIDGTIPESCGYALTRMTSRFNDAKRSATEQNDAR